MAQQVIADVVKELVNRQQYQHQPQQGAAGTGPVVTEVDDDGADLGFRSGSNPHTRPPDTGVFCVVPEPPRIPGSMEIVTRL